MLRKVVTQMKEMRTQAPIVFSSVVILLGVEIISAAIGPLVVPDHIYLRGYLSEQAETSIQEFYTGASRALVFDEVSGWLNRPGFSRKKWVIDQHGARTTQTISSRHEDKKRILFLGSSLTNGGSHIENHETISAAIEDSTTEALNFATMLYSLDQSLLLYAHRLHEFESDVVVVGLSGQPYEGLSNRFIPFRMREESNMPYFKPRYRQNGQELELLPVPSKDLCLTVTQSSRELALLEYSDGYFGSFENFKRFNFTPLGRPLSSLASRLQNLGSLLQRDETELDLLVALMHKLEGLTEDDGARLVFMLLPDQGTIAPGWRNNLPDKYGDMVLRLRDEGFELLDGRKVLTEADEGCSRLYHADRRHFSALGNRIIGAALKPML